MKTQPPASEPALAAHTAGPWRTYENAICAGHIVATATGRMICDTMSDYTSDAEQQANARLIASAPGLLAALESLSVAVRDAGKSGTNGNLARAEAQARAAIARAKGQP